MSGRVCSHHGCEAAPKNKAGFLCAPHWFKLPRELRDRIWQAYQARDSDASLRLIREALTYLRDREPAKEASHG